MSGDYGYSQELPAESYTYSAEDTLLGLKEMLSKPRLVSGDFEVTTTTRSTEERFSRGARGDKRGKRP